MLIVIYFHFVHTRNKYAVAAKNKKKKGFTFFYLYFGKNIKHKVQDP